MIEQCFNFLNTLPMANEYLCNIRIYLHWKMFLCIILWLKSPVACHSSIRDMGNLFINQDAVGQMVYRMTSVEISGERGCWKMCDSSTISDPHSYRPWDKSKNPYPLRNPIIPNKATAGTGGSCGPGSCQEALLLPVAPPMKSFLVTRREVWR